MKSGALICLFLASGAAACAHGQTYRNETYKFGVSVPEGLTICKTPAPGVNHGIVVLLDSSDCQKQQEVARIDFFAAYNVAYEADTSAALAKNICESKVGLPTDMKRDGVVLYRCSTVSETNLTKYFAVRPEVGKWVGDWVEFDISVYCPSQKCAPTMVKRVLSGLRLK